MERMVFVNLPVSDVGRSRAFYTALGFAVNERFSDDRVACIVVSETIVVMALEHDRYREFIADDDADAEAAETSGGVHVLNALSASSRAEVDDLVARAVAAGGVARTPVEQGGMYGRSFADPDGHVWELIAL